MKKLVSLLLVIGLVAALLTVSVSAGSDTPAGMTGGWSASESPEITEEVQALIDRAAEGLLGVDYTPVAYLGTQIVAGTNHCILCRARAVVPDAEPYYVLVYIYEDLSGGAEILDVKTLDPGKMLYDTTERQDGDRFEAVIVIEGMEETVRYEHVRNDTLGFEMDYDYESFVRQSEPVCERFVSVWDDPDDPENYLEIMYSAEDADTIAASVSASLSDDYDLLQDTRTLDRAGECIRIEASVLKGTDMMADQLEAVYIIPADDGCRIVTEHFSIESVEGFGRRFSYMLDTLEVIDRVDSYEESADAANFGELPDGWTGEDFGEQPDYVYEWTGEDFGEQPDYVYEWTGEDFGEQPDYVYEWTGEDFGEQPDYEYGN